MSVFKGNGVELKNLLYVRYVKAVLADLPNAFINRATEKRHFRPPLWKKKEHKRLKSAMKGWGGGG